jgi:hypothetical protein
VVADLDLVIRSGADGHPESAPAEVGGTLGFVGDELRGDLEDPKTFDRGLLG